MHEVSFGPSGLYKCRGTVGPGVVLNSRSFSAHGAVAVVGAVQVEDFPALGFGTWT